jgi:hypothetical protein
VKLEVHPYLNIQPGADAVAWVKEAVEVRCHMRGPEDSEKFRAGSYTPYSLQRAEFANSMVERVVITLNEEA